MESAIQLATKRVNLKFIDKDIVLKLLMDNRKGHRVVAICTLDEYNHARKNEHGKTGWRSPEYEILFLV